MWKRRQRVELCFAERQYRFAVITYVVLTRDALRTWVMNQTLAAFGFHDPARPGINGLVDRASCHTFDGWGEVSGEQAGCTACVDRGRRPCVGVSASFHGCFVPPLVAREVAVGGGGAWGREGV